MALKYYEKLPDVEEQNLKNKEISESEIVMVQKTLSGKTNIFEDLNNGMIPGLSNTMRPIEKND